MPDNDKRASTKPEAQLAPADPIPHVDVQQILDGAREAILIHAGEKYRLRITASGKLILTK